MSSGGEDQAEMNPPADVNRMVAFSDGVFTVAMTLLVLDLGVPDLGTAFSESDLQGALMGQLPSVFAFVLSFWVVALFWLGHHRQFRLIHRYDSGLLYLNLLFLMTVCFIPWPTALLGHYGGHLSTWLIYATSMAAAGFLSAALWVYGSGGRGLADGVTPDLRRYYTSRSLIQPCVFVLSMPLAAVALPLAWSASALGIVVLFAVVNRLYRGQVPAALRPPI